MELVTTAFKIVIDERRKEIKKDQAQIQAIIDQFRQSEVEAPISLLEIYEKFSNIVVESWQDVGQEIVGRIFDLLFKEWDLSSKISAPIKLRTNYLYNPEEDF